MNLKQKTVVIVFAIYVVMNIISFALMAYDKRCARQGRRRVPEKRLFQAAACFGALGGVIGMHLLRHKTKHWTFRVFFPLMFLCQVGLLVLGAWKMNTF